MSEPALLFRDLTLGYNSHPAVHHLDGAVRKGSLTAVVGANGSGKSTLMKGIVGALKPMAGAIVKADGVLIAYLPQQSELDRSFPARVVDLVSLGLWPRRGLIGRHRAKDRDQALGPREKRLTGGRQVCRRHCDSLRHSVALEHNVTMWERARLLFAE